MDLHTVFLMIFASLTIIVFILVTWTIHEFFRLDKELFKFYIIGLLFYGISIFGVFLRYVVFPPLSHLESIILEYCVTISVIIGIFYFIKGTEYLAQKEKPDFVRNEKLHNVVFYLVVIMSVFVVFYALTLLVSKRIYEILTIFSGGLALLIVFLALILMLEYQKAFGDIIAKIIYQYIITVILLVGSGLVITLTLVPIETGDHVFTDLSYFRNAIAVIGASIIIIPFVICLRSVSKFRKLLSG